MLKKLLNKIHFVDHTQKHHINQPGMQIIIIQYQVSNFLKPFVCTLYSVHWTYASYIRYTHTHFIRVSTNYFNKKKYTSVTDKPTYIKNFPLIGRRMLVCDFFLFFIFFFAFQFLSIYGLVDGFSLLKKLSYNWSLPKREHIRCACIGMCSQSYTW